MSSASTASIDKLVCPECKAELLARPAALICSQCQREHPVRDGIPDFLHAWIKGQRVAQWVRLPEKIRNRIGSWIYEKPSLLGELSAQLWFWLYAQLYESPKGAMRRGVVEVVRGERSVEEVLEWMISRVRPVKGLILDAGSGPGTLGRRVAGERGVFAVDIIPQVLKKGVDLAARENTRNIQFVRAWVESLPFRDATFDAALFGATLQIVRDPVANLAEIARVLRPGAPLCGGTFLKGGHNKYVQVVAEMGGHPFEVAELRKCLTDAGFVNVEIEQLGEFLLFAANRRD